MLSTSNTPRNLSKLLHPAFAINLPRVGPSLRTPLANALNSTLTSGMSTDATSETRYHSASKRVREQEDDQVLFKPLRVGAVTLSHRVAMAPLTRNRADDKHVPIRELVVEPYAQRAAIPGTLLIAEGTLVSPQSTGWPNAPGIWSKEQVAAWKEVSRHSFELALM